MTTANQHSVRDVTAVTGCALENITPHHPLAYFAINTIQRQSLQLAEVVTKMGYSASQHAKAIKRLLFVLTCPTLGLNASHFDFKYSRDEFIIALFAAIDIIPEHYQSALKSLQASTAQKPPKMSYALRAEIDFPTANRSWNTQWGLSKFKQLPLPKNFIYIGEDEQAMIVQNRIREHYQRYKSDLPADGVIRSYFLLCVTDDERQRTDFKLPNA